MAKPREGGALLPLRGEGVRHVFGADGRPRSDPALAGGVSGPPPRVSGREGTGGVDSTPCRTHIFLSLVSPSSVSHCT